MATTAEPAWFQKAREGGELVVSDPPKFDFDSYIANYKGKLRILRLLHIGRTSTYLSHEALRSASAEAKAGKDVELYLKVMKVFHAIMPDDAESRTDVEWMSQTEREAAAETRRLEGELRGYKNNLIKESIRMAYDDMGKHYQHIGAFAEAIKAFNKEREYCQLPTHIAIMVNRLIHANIEQSSWLSVESNVQKLRTIGQKPTESEQADAKLSAVQGLAELSTSQYRKAALTLLDCSPAMIQGRLKENTVDDSLSEAMTPNDVATYGALCALATMDRSELQKRVLENANFRNYLELEPHLRRAISSFVAGKYSQCLEILDAYRTDYILDMYLCQHYDRLYTLIRNKAIVQYFIPFSRVTFKALAVAFKTNEDDIVESLTELIKSDQISTTLDLENGLLVARKTESRAEMFKSAMDTSQEYEKTLQSRLLKFAILNANAEIIAPPKSSLNAGGGNGDLLIARGLDMKSKLRHAREDKGFFG